MFKINNNEATKLWDLLLETGVATEDELQTVTNINGYNQETLEDVLFIKTAWRGYEQATEALKAGHFYSNM